MNQAVKPDPDLPDTHLQIKKTGVFILRGGMQRLPIIVDALTQFVTFSTYFNVLRWKISFQNASTICVFDYLRSFFLLLFIGSAIHFSSSIVHAWPTDSDWNPLYRSGTFVDDPEGDTATSRDVVGDSTFPAASLYNDGTYIYFRIRLDDDPRDNSLTALDPFGWGFLIDTDGDTGDYEYMIMLDGIVNPEEIYLAENTVKTNLSDPSDKAETIVWSQLLNNDPTSGNYRVLTSVDSGGPTSNFGGDSDFYIDYRMPFDVFKTTLGLNDDSLIRLFIGSSNSAQTLTADLGTTASSAYDGLLNDGVSDEVLPNGELPSTGSLTFVSDLSGNGDVTEFYPGNPVYIRVDDSDQNGIPTLRETITVTITAPSGDSETLTLTETGDDSSVFTAALPTSEQTATNDDGILQVSPVEFATATYVDAADADLDQFELRTDSIKALPAADLYLSKSVDNPTPNEGDTITFSVTLGNNGPSTATSIQVTDQLPAGVTYVNDSSGGSYNPSTGIWSVASIAPATSVTLDITATVNTGTTLTTITNNAATTSHAQPDPDTSNDSDSASIAITGADIALSITANTTTPTSGGNVILTLTATNNGSYDATGITITDLWNIAELSYVSHIASAGGYVSGAGSGIWTLGPLANGASETLQITTTILAASNSTVNQTANISAVDQGDPVPANDTASIDLFIGGTDLALSKTVDNSTPDVGDTITYTLTLENLGANSASGIQVEDLLPAGVTYSSHISQAGTSYDPASGNWDFGATSLVGSANVSLLIDATIDSGTAGQTITNTATILTGPVDPDPTNDTDNAAVAIRYIDLEITKTVDNITPQDNDAIVFTITVENKGLIDATNVVIFDELPGQLAYTGSSATQGTYSTATDFWTVGTITVGSTQTLTINCNVDIGNNDAPTFFNFASLQSADQEDPIDDNNTDSVLLGIAGTDISVSKSVDNANPSTGDTITYSLVVINNGPNDATNLEISEVLPAGLTYVSSTDDYAAAQDQTAYNSGTGDWVIGHKSGGDTILPAYTTVNLTVTATVTAASGTTLTNTALVKSLDEAETDATNNTSQVSIIVGGSDLGLAMTADDPTPTVGDTVTYTITLTNNGPDTPTGVTILDLLPAGLTYTGSSPAAGTTYNNATGIWNVGSLAPATPITLTISATVDAGTGGTTINNTATVSTSSLPDPFPASDTANVALVIQEADVSLTKIADDANPDEGTSVTFTVTVFNAGPNDATGIQISDLLPAGLTYSSHVAEPGTTYDNGSGLWDLSSLTIAKLASASLTITASVDLGTGGSNITNTASVTAADAYDPNISNNSADATITPTAVPAANLTIVKMASSANAQPGDIITYTIIVTNTGAGAASSVTLDDLMMSDYVALRVDPYGNGTPFSYTDPIPFSASGLTINTISYEDQGAAPIALTDSGGGAPAGSDGRIAKWTITYNGTLPVAESFTIQYQTVIK